MATDSGRRSRAALHRTVAQPRLSAFMVMTTSIRRPKACRNVSNCWTAIRRSRITSTVVETRFNAGRTRTASTGRRARTTMPAEAGNSVTATMWPKDAANGIATAPACPKTAASPACTMNGRVTM